MASGGGDLLFQDEILEAVRSAYGSIPAGAGRAMAERFYSPEELARVPAAAIEWALGVGNPVRHAALRSGETVLDLGCGAGIDAVLAADRVGPSGRVIGLDALVDMCDRARAVAAEAGTSPWSEFRTGEMERIPLPDASVDVVISNGVLNLSPRKSRALAEVARVLRPGGRLCIVDLTVDGDLPPEILASGAAWAGCIAGAMSERVLRRKLERAGFHDVEMSDRVPFSLDDVARYPLFTDDTVALMRSVLPPAAQRRIAVGLVLQARLAAASRAGGDDAPAVVAAASGTVALADIPPDDVEAPGVEVRHLKTVEDVALKVLDVEPGGSTPFHSHPHAHEGVVISGRGALRLDGRSERLGPGDVFTVNPADPHSIVNHGAEPLRFVCMDCFID